MNWLRVEHSFLLILHYMERDGIMVKDFRLSSYKGTRLSGLKNPNVAMVIGK